MGTTYGCCGLTFASEGQLVEHQVKDHGQERSVVGECCGIDFYTKAGWQEHQRAHRASETRQGGEKG